MDIYRHLTRFILTTPTLLALWKPASIGTNANSSIGFNPPYPIKTKQQPLIGLTTALHVQKIISRAVLPPLSQANGQVASFGNCMMKNVWGDGRGTKFALTNYNLFTSSRPTESANLTRHLQPARLSPLIYNNT